MSTSSTAPVKRTGRRRRWPAPELREGPHRSILSSDRAVTGSRGGSLGRTRRHIVVAADVCLGDHRPNRTLGAPAFTQVPPHIYPVPGGRKPGSPQQELTEQRSCRSAATLGSQAAARRRVGGLLLHEATARQAAALAAA